MCLLLFPRFALIRSEFVRLANYTRQRAERESGAATMRLRATRTAVTTNGQGCRHGKRITRAAALVFFLVTFSKVKKPPGAGRNPASFVPRRARTFGRRAARPEGCGRLDAGVPPALGDFLYAQKVTKDAHERGISISPSHDFSLEATQEGRPRPSWITPEGTGD